MNTKNNILRVGGAVVFKENRGKRQFFLIKDSEEEKWEFPKVIARRGESSVRATIRMMAEMGGINARVLEEAGRGTGVATVHGRTTPQKYYYYLMVYRAAGEVIGFAQYEWLEYDKATKLLSLKREKDVLKEAKNILKEWEKQRQTKG